jgi:hypothetical protein
LKHTKCTSHPRKAGDFELGHYQGEFCKFFWNICFISVFKESTHNSELKFLSFAGKYVEMESLDIILLGYGYMYILK